MNNNSKTEDQNKEISQIRENYEDEYWGKKYGVSSEEIKSEEIKKSGHNKDISSRIIEAAFKKKSYSL